MLEPVIPRRMRAAVITAPRTCEVQLVETPQPAADQVLVRVEGCGVCGSNLPLWEGRSWFTYPAAPGNPGHEGWGRVVAVGRRVRSVAVGSRVAFLSERAFAEYDVAGAASLVELPPTLDAAEVPGEPLGCAMNIWRRSAIEPGQTVAVIGVGFLGALLVQLAASAGARVIAISQRPFSLDLARRMGAATAIELGGDDGPIVARVEELTGGQGCDRVIELVGLQRPLDLAGKLCRVRGRLVIGGFHQDGPRQVDMFLWNWRGLDVINAHEREPAAYISGISEAVDHLCATPRVAARPGGAGSFDPLSATLRVAAHPGGAGAFDPLSATLRVAARPGGAGAFDHALIGRFDPEPLYTHRLDLDLAGEAFELLRQRPAGFVKALVLP